MKSIYTFAFSIICLFITTKVCSQDLTDQEIGFNEARVSVSLQEHGITNPEELNREVEHIRETYKKQYLIMKKNEEELLLIIPPKQLLKGTADIPQNEKDALRALYDNTGGANWTNKTGWDFNTPVTTWNSTTKTGWYGVYVIDGHVTSVVISNNNLTGQIPKEIGQLKYLQLLHFNSNKLTGNIPIEIGQLTNLRSISLTGNKLSGSIPEEFYNLQMLTSASLNANELSGSLSPNIKKLINLVHLDWSFNQISGAIPSEIGELSKNLEILYLYVNKFNGVITQEIYNINSLKDLNLSMNKFSGTVSNKIIQLINLEQLDLGYNELTGGITREIVQLKKLNCLILTSNKLTGSIPPEIGLSKLEVVFLGQNQLSGIIPKEIALLSGLRALILSNNLLEGQIPDLTNLTSLSLSIFYCKFRFIDFASQFYLYKTKSGYHFNFEYQNNTDTPKTISSTSGKSVTLTMCEDGRFLADDTFQWYKNSTAIAGATSRIYTISNLKATDAGQYSCKSYHTNNPDMSPLVLEREPITLKVENCTPVIGTIKVIN